MAICETCHQRTQNPPVVWGKEQCPVCKCLFPKVVKEVEPVKKEKPKKKKATKKK